MAKLDFSAGIDKVSPKSHFRVRFFCTKIKNVRYNWGEKWLKKCPIITEN